MSDQDEAIAKRIYNVHVKYKLVKLQEESYMSDRARSISVHLFRNFHNPGDYIRDGLNHYLVTKYV